MIGGPGPRRTVALGAAMCAVLCAVLALAGCGQLGNERGHRVLGPDAEPLRAAFNADVGRVRLLMLVGPTCGVCLRGAADVQDRVLARTADARLRTYVVWVPTLGAQERHVPEATGTVPDARAEHFWAPDERLMWAYSEVLGLGETPGWDIYLFYGPDARWDGERPPTPTFWMHQLSGIDTTAPVLNADALSDRVEAELARGPGG